MRKLVVAAVLAAVVLVGCLPERGRRGVPMDPGPGGSDGAIDVDGGAEPDPTMGYDAGGMEPPPVDGGREPVPMRDSGMPGFDAGGPGVDAGPAPMSFVGDPCTSDADCGPSGACIPETDTDGSDTGFVGGYCLTIGCGADSPCPGGSTCYLLGSDRTPACIENCASDSDCRAGYVCDADSTCWPGCSASRACPSGFTCGAGGTCASGTGGGGMTGTMCSPTNPTGTCPTGQLCISGACATPPPCSSDSYEPNDTRTSATSLTVGTSLTGGRCSGDTDWFRITVPAGQLVTVLATFPSPTSANLDLYAYRADGTALGGRVAYSDTTPSWARAYETNEEAFGFYGGPTTPATYYVKVTGATSTASGSYTIAATSTPWRDGPTCSGEGFSTTECTSGPRGAQTLLPFPFPDANDPYLGALGYHFDSVSNYRWLRRETMMLLRYAQHEVARQFPGTRPLGLIDMCQRDAITPGYDVGDPRHPESTHDQGGNIDVAYYQTLSDNHARVVCDASEGHSDGYFCTAGSESTHVVDLPRTVYFIVALARSSRLRVVGIDRVIGPLLAAEARRMRDAGTITTTEYNAFVAKTTWGDGWPFHHHHLHISMQWL